MQILLSRTQAEAGRTVKQEQEEISRNHIHTFIYLSVLVRKVSFNQSEIDISRSSLAHMVSLKALLPPSGRSAY